MIEAFGAFGAGFLTRPLGALLFGWIGDHHGRERALTLSIFAMALPTFLTGTLPDYAHDRPARADYSSVPEDAPGLVGGW
jgi:MFS family permease